MAIKNSKTQLIYPCKIPLELEKKNKTIIFWGTREKECGSEPANSAQEIKQK